MWVRAVAVVLAVGCWAVGVQAAQYAEAWNPPETRHAPKKVKSHASAGKKMVAKGAAAGGKNKLNKPHKLAAKKATPHADHKAALHAGHKTATRGKPPAKTHDTVGAKSGPKKPRGMSQANVAPVHAAAHPKGRKAAVPHAVADIGARTARVSARPAVNSVATRVPTQAATSAPVQSAPAMASTTAKPPVNGGDLPPILH